ncbi:MAG: DUF1223 domain-containing protein [Rhizobiaceae bacterium]
MKAKLKSSALAAFALIASLSGASAEPVKGVVELFTSQGCSSCPPADKVLGSLVERDGVIALGYHVNYWDYLGWKDTFSSEESTARQYGYATSFGSTQVYTPQFIVNGRTSVRGHSPDNVSAAMDDMAKSGQGLPVTVNADLNDERLSVAVGQGLGTANLVMVIFDAQSSVAIERGENGGSEVEYHNAVTGIQTIGMWKGEELSVDLPRGEYLKEKGHGCAILLQRMTDKGTPGEIIGATIISGASL